MKLETFFEKFNHFADAPDAVAKIRQLVLSLALNGSVIGLDASKWDRVCLGSLGEWGSGGTPLRSEPQYYGGSIPWLVIGDLNDGVVTSASSTITEEGLTNSSARLLPKGVLLIAMYGSIGKMGITGIDCATNQAIAFCKPEPTRTDLRYLFHTLKGIQPALLARGQGLAQKNISQTILKAWEINLPPLAEQKRIVAKVDELMALCDRLEAQQQERESRHAGLARASLARFADAPTPANVPLLFHPSYAISAADLRKAILTLAVQGRLVTQDLNDEPAADWLQQVSESDSDREVDGLRMIATPSTCSQFKSSDTEFAELPFSLPQGWIWLHVASVFEVAGGIQKTPQRAPRNNAFPYLGVGNVYRGRLDLSNVKQFELEPGELERRRLKAGDLLIIEGNGSFNEIGRCAKWNGEIENCVHQNHVIRCRPKDDKISDFVLLFLNSPIGVENMQRLAITSSGLYSLSVGKIRQIQIPIPPLAEQRRIVAKVEQLMALVDELETQLAASQATSARLLSALVAELTGKTRDGKVAVPSGLVTARKGRAKESLQR